MFHLTDQEATLTAQNAIVDRQGKEKYSRFSFTLSMSMPNTVLDLLDPKLRFSFYRPADAIAKQHIENIREDTTTPILLHPELGPQTWNRMLTATVVELSAGDLLDKLRVRLTDCDIDSFGFKCIEGGTVTLTCRVKCDPAAPQVGEMYKWHRKTLRVSVTPPTHATYEPAESADDDEPMDEYGAADEEVVQQQLPETAQRPQRGRNAAAKKPAAQKVRKSRAFPTVMDATGETDPFAAKEGQPPHDAWPFPRDLPADTAAPDAGTLQ